MIRAIAVIMLAAMLAACGEGRVKIETVEVKVPVKVPCIQNQPTEPAYQTGRGPYPGESAALLALAADFEAAKDYGRRWAAVSVGCIIPAQEQPATPKR